MIVHPLEREREENTNQSVSKNKSYNNSLLPLTIKQIGMITANKKDLLTLGRIVLIGRVLELKEMVGRTQIKISDNTGMTTIIESQGVPGLEQNEYFKFIATVRLEKQEPVLYSQHCKKIQNFNELLYHWTCVMSTAYTNEQIKI